MILLTWVIMLKINRLYAVPAAVVVAVGAILATGGGGSSGFIWPSVELVAPVFTIEALISLAIPLFIVTMASQNITGLAVLATFDFKPNPRDGLLATGGMSVLTAPFGAATINFAAITAALCASPRCASRSGPALCGRRRWGIGYMLLALLAGVVTALVVYSSPLLIEAVAGLALIGSFASATAGRLLWRRIASPPWRHCLSRHRGSRSSTSVQPSGGW